MASSHAQSGKSVFMFPGQGSFTDTLMHEIVEAYPELNRRVEIAASIIRKQFGKDLSSIMYSSPSPSPSEPIENDFELSQCVIYLTGYFLQEILRSRGLQPDLIIGHSVGEIPALAAAGAFSFEDGLRITCMRTHAIQQYAREGKMYAINTTAAQVQHLIHFVGDPDLCVAVVNGRSQTVVSGSSQALSKLLKLTEAAGLASIKLKSAYPFHSALMLKAVPSFSNSIKEIKYLEPAIPVYSPILGRFYEKQDDLKEILAFQLVQPVHFSEGVGHLYTQGARTFYETGGKNSLTALARSILDNHIGFSAHECHRKSMSLKENIDQVVKGGITVNPVTLTASVSIVPTKSIASNSEVTSKVLNIFKELTNYPEEILEMDADLESDLGLDSVKQIEIMSALMKEFAIPAQENIEIAKYNTIRKTVDYIAQQLVTGGKTQVVPVQQAVAAIAAVPVAVQKTAVSSVASAEVQSRVLKIFKDLTNYPEEILELDADLESDLGLDSVKQIEIMSALMKEFAIPAQENIEIAKYNTIRKTVDYIAQQLVAGGKPQLVSEIVATAVAAPASQPVAVLRPAAPIVASAAVQGRVLKIFKDLTNYPEEILELDADLESDLGLDSVKQIEIMSALMKEFSIPAQENIEIAKYNTIRKTVGYVELSLSQVNTKAS